MFWQRLYTTFRLLIVAALFAAAVAPEWPTFGDERYGLETVVRQRAFDFLVWELDALQAKIEAALVAGDDYLPPDTGRQFVRDYLNALAEARRLEREMERIYTDPAVSDPAAAVGGMPFQAAMTRRDLARLQPVMEAILEEQVAGIIMEAGFGALGQLWPPLQMHMTPLPSVLIVSPRHEIKQLYGIPLQHGLLTPEQEAMEAAVHNQLDRSALVVPIGGLGIYPAMVLETGNLNFLADTMAHEWAHHWLTFRPLGARYAVDPTMRTMNETVASIFGREIGAQVIARYYPELVPPPPTLGPAPVGPVPETPAEPPAFDFRAEMRATRVRVDELLAQGEIEPAEAYMNERRELFVANGYPIRKLNQAYFAFYGSYADEPGAAGADPIGPLVIAVRAQSPSLHNFMARMAAVTSFEELQEVTR